MGLFTSLTFNGGFWFPIWTSPAWLTFWKPGAAIANDPDTAAQAEHPEPAFDVACRGQGQRLLGIRGRDRCARHGLPALVPDRSGDSSHDGLSRDSACSRQEHEGEEQHRTHHTRASGS